MNQMIIDDMLIPERIIYAMNKCENNVRWKASIQNYEVNTLRWAASIRNEVRTKTFKTKGFKRFDIMERGKIRHIQAVHISERTVQKLLCCYALRPVICKRIIYDNSASQKGKGTEFALKRLKEHLRWHYARYGKSGTVITIDYHDYFNSIPHEKVINTLLFKQTDETIRYYIKYFINAFDGDVGIGLGSEISQLAAVLYPTTIDKIVKEKYKIHCYGRYNDDSYLIHQDREYAIKCLNDIKTEAKALGIIVNDSKTKIHNLASDDFVFLKKRVHLSDNGKILLRLSKSNIIAEEKRITQMRDGYIKGEVPFSAIMQSYKSWRGYAQKYNAYKAVGNMDRFFVKNMRDIIKKETGNDYIKFH